MALKLFCGDALCKAAVAITAGVKPASQAFE
jgi:hypothetical protein